MPAILSFVSRRTIRALADKERNLIVMVVRSLEQTLASSSSPAFRDRRALGRRLINNIPD